ncbi:MAG: InlB B-repeat-containing protein, partial [Clostridia bacterium]|nr:InlB B-repeat-containing protein [Clostridia bacterium]
MKKKLFCLILSLLMVLSLLPGFAGAETDPEETEVSSEPAAAVSESPVVRGVHNTIIIDDDPTDGYEGDYVVIYNPSTTASNSLSTGNLTGLIETTVEPSIVPNPDMHELPESELPIWKLDIDSQLEKPKEPYKRDPSLMKASSFSVGDTKTFEILGQYSPTGSDSIEFECLYVGEHCYIWTPVSSANNTYPLDEIDSTYAKMAADEFDSKFDLMQSSFGDHENGDGDGKLHMLYYNIDEGWNGSGGYVAGFFYAYDLYYNNLPILNIDTYPGVYYKNPNSGNVYKRMDDTYNTMVHEYQHLINYSNTSSMDTWLNECFSAAAEEICYPGSSVVDRIQSWENYYYSSNNDWLNPPAEFEYQSSFQLHNGYSMYNWSNSISDVLALYAQVSFFAQYLFTRFGNSIYRQISNAYTSSEVNAITSATGVSCAELVKAFRVAVTANAAQDQYGGIYGFKAQNGYDPSQYNNVQNPWDLLSPIVFTGNAAAIKGGGAITVKPIDGVFNPPSDAGENLQYIGIKLASPYTVTAISNNETWGTVSVEDTKITCVPAEGYYVADYEVMSGTATATIRDNIVRVNPESDCTIKVIFAPKPSYTVTYMASGSAQGQATALHGDTITLPSSVTVNPEGWTYIGWTDTEIPEETEAKPTYFAPGADYTVTANVTLYAVYSRIEEGVGAPVYNLISEAPADWSGNYVITYRTVNSTSSPMYVMKGVLVSSNGTAIEGNYNCDQYAVTGAVLDGTTLKDVTDTYVFTMEKHGSYYSIQNVATGMYLGINGNDYLAGYKTYTSSNCDWTPGFRTNASSAKIAKSSSYPLISMYIDGPYFWADSSNNTAALYVRFWKEINGDATYYTTNPVVTEEGPAFMTQSLLLSGKIGVRFYVRLPEIEGYEYTGVDFTIEGMDGEDSSVAFSSDLPTNTKGYYGFTFYVGTIQMADTITATLNYKVDGESQTLEKTYSVKEYFEAFDANYEAHPELYTDANVVELIKATADLGHYVQTYLDET